MLSQPEEPFCRCCTECATAPAGAHLGSLGTTAVAADYVDVLAAVGVVVAGVVVAADVAAGGDDAAGVVAGDGTAAGGGVGALAAGVAESADSRGCWCESRYCLHSPRKVP